MSADYSVEVLPTAAREFARLPPHVMRRVAVALRELEHDPRPRNSKKLRGSRNAYRLRLGDHRVLYEINKARLLLTVLQIGARRDIY